MMSSSSSSSFVVASRNKKPREKREEKEKDKKNGDDIETLNYCETPNEPENASLNIPLSSLSCLFFLSLLFPLIFATFFLDAL